MVRKKGFDEDLVQQRDWVPEVKTGQGNEPPDDDEPPVSETVPVHDLELTPLTKRKEEINTSVAGKLEELELLRSRQESLEREKNALEHLRNNQEKYEIEKRELIDRLEQHLVSFEREEMMLNRRLECLQETRKSFKAMDVEMRSVKEEEWPMDSDGYRDELTKGLAVLEDMRKEYHRAVSRLEALRESGHQRTRGQALTPDEESEQGAAGRRSFGEWLVIGFAFTLPVVLALIALLALLIIRQPFY